MGKEKKKRLYPLIYIYIYRPLFGAETCSYFHPYFPHHPERPRNFPGDPPPPPQNLQHQSRYNTLECYCLWRNNTCVNSRKRIISLSLFLVFLQLDIIGFKGIRIARGQDATLNHLKNCVCNGKSFQLLFFIFCSSKNTPSIQPPNEPIKSWEWERAHASKQKRKKKKTWWTSLAEEDGWSGFWSESRSQSKVYTVVLWSRWGWRQSYPSFAFSFTCSIFFFRSLFVQNSSDLTSKFSTR